MVSKPKTFGLTPIIEDMAELYLSSQKKMSKDDFDLGNKQLPHQEVQKVNVNVEDNVNKQLNLLFDKEAANEALPMRGKRVLG